LLQEELISKLETDLELAETQLQLKEEELEQWKKHVLRLNELSFCSPIPGKLFGPLLLVLIILASWNARITDRYLDHWEQLDACTDMHSRSFLHAP
jgi:hypothetical protein